jgi:hypothetical protein
VGSNEKKIKDDEQSLYEDYWNGKWKCNLVDLEQWFNILVVFFFVSYSEKYNLVLITISCVTPPKVNLDATNASSNL